jgi:hypothetical protein
MDLLKQNRFDLVVNVHSPSKTIGEELDGKEIKGWSVKNGVQLITDYDVLANTIEKMGKYTKMRSAKVSDLEKRPALL